MSTTQHPDVVEKGTVWEVCDEFEDKHDGESIRFSFNKHDLNEPHVSIKGFFA